VRDCLPALVDVEPWDIQDYVLKRAFDLLFSTGGSLVLSPVIRAIAVAIKLDDGGAILDKQEQTSVFGEAFDVSKFRSMVENAEEQTGATISDEDAVEGSTSASRGSGASSAKHISTRFHSCGRC